MPSQCCFAHFPPLAIHVAMRAQCELVHIGLAASAGGEKAPAIDGRDKLSRAGRNVEFRRWTDEPALEVDAFRGRDGRRAGQDVGNEVT